MGEYADYEIDRWVGDCSWRFPRPPRPARRLTCSRCGARDLQWDQIEGGDWRLHNRDGDLHVCDTAAPIDAFPVLP